MEIIGLRIVQHRILDLEHTRTTDGNPMSDDLMKLTSTEHDQKAQDSASASAQTLAAMALAKTQGMNFNTPVAISRRNDE